MIEEYLQKKWWLVKMAFDISLDQEIAKKTLKFEGSNITVGVYSYNDGPKKIQLGRERVNAAGDTSFSKLGRLTKDEGLSVAGAIADLVKDLE